MRRILALTLALAIVSLGVPRTSSAAGRQVAAKAANGRVDGVVKDSGGQPVTNRGVRLRDAVKAQVVSTSRTNSGGAFSFDNVPAGTYVVEVIDDRGGVVALSGPLTLNTGSMLVDGLVIVLQSDQAAAAVVAAGGSFFSSTAGMLILAAAGAGAVVAIKALTSDKSPSK
jgi:uncharacterized protein (DUF2141 family)